jgi:hypothetical protein
LLVIGKKYRCMYFAAIKNSWGSRQSTKKGR